MRNRKRKGTEDKGVNVGKCSDRQFASMFFKCEIISNWIIKDDDTKYMFIEMKNFP